jgi:hypothetical protein
MSRRVLLAVLFGAVLLALFAWRTSFATDAVAPPAPPPATGSAASHALAAPAPTPPPVVSERLGVDSSAASLPQRRMRVIDERGTPVANADVAWDLSEELCEHWRPFPFDVEERFANAPRLRTTSDGIAVLPTDAARAFVIARAGERFGHRVLEFDSQLREMPELPIAPDRTLRIAVVSPRGEPRPDVPVAMTFTDSDPFTRYPTTTLYLPRTGPDGTTVMWHAQTLWFWDRSRAAVDLSPLVLGAKSTPVHVALSDPAPERIVLECPDHGGVRVSARWSAGAANRAKVHRWIHTHPGYDQGPAELLVDGASLSQWRFFPVALGAMFETGTRHAAVDAFAGPVQHGADVAVDLDLQLEALTARRATLLRPDGQSCANEEIVLDPLTNARKVTTDEAGGITFWTTRQTVTFAANRLRAEATLPVPDAPENGTRDLGVVRLLPQVLLAQGRVVEAATRRPVRIHVEATVTGPDDAPKEVARMVTAADGAFELWGIASGKITLDLEKTAYAHVLLEVDVGSRDLVVAMPAARRLRARVSVDPDIAIDSLDICVRTADDAKIWRTAMIECGSFHGLFELPDGDDLVFDVRGCDGGPVLREVPMREWVAEEGAFATSVDLRGQLGNVIVNLRGQKHDDDESGGSVYVRPQASRAPWAYVEMSERFAFVVPRGTVLDAVVRPDGGCCIRTTLREGENTIDVPDPPAAVFELSGLPPNVQRSSISVRIWRLVRAEPLLDALVADGVWNLDPEDNAQAPRTAEDLENMAGEMVSDAFGDGPLRFVLHRRGSYVAVPFAGGEQWKPMLRALVKFELTAPGQVVQTTIRLDPDEVRSALK